MLHHQIRGQGKPILMLHGVTLDHRHMMDAMEPAFEELVGWKRVYVDLPGHGQSPPQDGIRSQDDLLHSVMDFAKEYFKSEPFGLAGYSRGSYIARGMVHLTPENIFGLALFTPGGNPSSDPKRLPSHQVLEPNPSIRDGLSDDELWAFDNMSVVQNQAIVEKRRRVITPARQLFDEEQEARVFKSFEFSFRDNEKTSVFDKPSLIVAGRQDSISGYLDAIELMPKFPRATVSVLDTAGHGLSWERPGLFKRLVRDWLERMETAL